MKRQPEIISEEKASCIYELNCLIRYNEHGDSNVRISSKCIKENCTLDINPLLTLATAAFNKVLTQDIQNTGKDRSDDILKLFLAGVEGTYKLK